jgi:hypothetical protein
VKCPQYTEGRVLRQGRWYGAPDAPLEGTVLQPQPRTAGASPLFRSPLGALVAVLAVALLACLYVALYRAHVESQSRRVEIAMDYTDFSALARSYGYNELAFLIALRRAGLTSLAVAEELGSGINLSNGAILIPGQTLIDTARVTPLSDPTLAAMLALKRVSPADLYLIVSSPADLARYRAMIPLHLGPHAVRTVRASLPAILAIRSQVDFFSSLAFGLPAGPLALTHRAHLLLDPRLQNDERFGAPQINALFDSFRHGQRVSTVIFFGLRNEVLGFPDHLDDTADAFKRTKLNFGAIETYDQTQVQKGNEGLAQRVIAQTARVQAISKTEQDKLDLRTIVARYLLGVRERNVRVVYLRPYLHAEGNLSPEAANVEMVKQIAEGLKAQGFKLGRATPIRSFSRWVDNPVVMIVASLAVPAGLLLLLSAFGVAASRRLVAWAFGADVVLMLAGYAAHHDLLARKIVALTGAILFAVGAVVAVARAFTDPERSTSGAALRTGLWTVAIATATALAGALVVVGLLSGPLTMDEIERFSGVKAVLVVPPLIAVALYLYTPIFGRKPLRLGASAQEPVLIYQLIAAFVLLGVAYLYVSRSGNQSDVAPSAFELSLRSGLTAVLGVRPRFKEFLIGFPLMMLLPALTLRHRQVFGWLFALGIGIGTADMIDTFSHLHTPLEVSLIRLLNGLVIGCIVGAIAVLAYRRWGRVGAAPG